MLPESTRRAFLACSAALLAVRPARAEAVTLRASEEDLTFGDIRLKAAAYNGRISGPALTAASNTALNLVVENATDFPFSFEVQGLRGKALTGADAPIAPGEKRDITVTPPDAGAFVYRASGGNPALLSGPLIVSNNPSAAGDREIVVAVNTLFLPDKPRTLIVNGGTRLDAKVRPGERVRLRLINLSGQAVTGARLPQGARVVAIDGQPCEPFPPFDDSLFLPPHGRADIALDAPWEITPIVIADAFDPAMVLANINVEGEPMPAPALPVKSPPNPALPREIPLQSATRKTWKPGAEIADPLVKVRSGRSVVLTFENDATPRAVLLQGHSARHLDTLDDGWKPWWQDTHLLHPDETARLAFVAEQAGRYAVEIVPLEGGGKAEMLWVDVQA